MNRFVGSSALLAVSAVLAAGCSSSSGSKATSTTSAATSAVSSPAVTSPVASSAAPSSASASPSASASAALPTSPKLAAIMLRAADVGAGWTASPHEDDPNDAQEQAALVQCVGGRNTDADRVAQANSPDFQRNGASVSSSATTYKTQADVNADLTILRSPKISECYEQLAKSELTTSLPAGSTLDGVTMKIKSGANGGPANVVATGLGVLTATVSGKQVTVNIGVAFITGPLTEVEVDIENPSQLVPTAYFARLVKTVADRAAA